MTTIFEALRADHDKQRDLAAQLIDTTGSTDGRAEIFAALKQELEAHATHEEREFYVPLMTIDLTQEKARHSVAEHKELDDKLEQLKGYDLSAPQFLIVARELAELLTHHLDEEEQEVFQLAGKALTDEQKTDLAKQYEQGMASARS